jgi:hypothetical protein
MTSHLSADLRHLAESGTLSRAVPGPACEIGKAQTASLRSLGHKLERFLSAREVVHRRIAQDDAFASLRPWLGEDPTLPAILQGDGTFVTALVRSDAGVRIGSVMLPAEVAEPSLTLWRQTDPEAPKVLPPLVPTSPEAQAPLWLALLRLRPLRSVWESVLRRDHFETLLQVFPDAWLLDPSPLPPGAVIPRLELSRWGEFPARQNGNERYVIAASRTVDGAQELNGSMPASQWAEAVEAALASSATEPRILVDLPSTPDSWLFAFYEKRGSRVDAKGFLSLAKTGEGSWQAAKVR